MRLSVLLCIGFILYGCKSPENTVNVFGISDLNFANRTMLETVMTDGFSPPVASRVYVYPHIAHYVSYSIFYPEKLNDITAVILPDFIMPDPKEISGCNAELTSLLAFCYTAKILVFSEYKMEELAAQLISKAKEKGLSKSVIQKSSALAQKITDRINQRIRTDQYKETRTMERWTSVKEPGKWKETPPDYLSGLEPHWSKIKPLVIDSASIYKATPLPSFSTRPDSDFHKMAKEVYVLSQSLDSTQIETAWFWDDIPNTSDHKGHSMAIIHKISPPGHWLNIIAQISEKENLTPDVLTRLYCYSAIAMFDGLISCWYEKYKTNLVRPISYIQEYIDPEWRPLIQTPPFPEYTSGHSVLSAAAAEVLTQILGDSLSFTDSTQTMFDGPVRSFTGFHEAAWEVSMSRFYGGIHFRPGIEEGNKQGKYIGQMVMKKLYKQ